MVCSKHGSTAYSSWQGGTSYVAGDKVSSGNLIFVCVRDHTSGDSSATKDPAVGNKTSWHVTGTVDGSVSEYSSTYRYAQGVHVTYMGVEYVRTGYTINGGQTPSSGSQYWDVA